MEEDSHYASSSNVQGFWTPFKCLSKEIRSCEKLDEALNGRSWMGFAVLDTGIYPGGSLHSMPV